MRRLAIRVLISIAVPSAISAGTTGYQGYEQILLTFSYPRVDLHTCSNDDFMILTVTAIRWLETTANAAYVVEGTSQSDAALSILADALEAIPFRSDYEDSIYHGFSSSSFLQALWTWNTSRSPQTSASAADKAAAQSFAMLLVLHQTRGLWTKKDLRETRIPSIQGNPGADRVLHTLLQDVHDGISGCEVEGCRWVGHTCGDASQCPVLFPRSAELNAAIALCEGNASSDSLDRQEPSPPPSVQTSLAAKVEDGGGLQTPAPPAGPGGYGGESGDDDDIYMPDDSDVEGSESRSGASSILSLSLSRVASYAPAIPAPVEPLGTISNTSVTDVDQSDAHVSSRLEMGTAHLYEADADDAAPGWVSEEHAKDEVSYEV